MARTTITVKHAQLLVALTDFGAEFLVEAGKYDGDDENCKYVERFATYDEALAALNKVSDYPWHRVRVVHPELSALRMEKALAQHDAEMRQHARRVVAKPEPAAFSDYYEYVAACRAHARRTNQRVVSYLPRNAFEAAHAQTH